MEEHSTQKDTGISAPHKAKEHHKSSHSQNSHKANGSMELKKPFWQYLSAGLAVVLVIVLFAQYDLSIDITRAGSVGSGAVADDMGAAAADAGAADPSGSGAAVAYDASDYYDESDPVIGNADAPVTIVEFSDFQCPFCARFYSQTYLTLKEEYVDTGKVKIVFRDFPLGFHPEAEPSAIAAECAHEQGKFWEFHDLIFENQGIMSASAYLDWAEQLSLDMTQFTDCVDSQKYKSEVAKDYNDGGRLGITGTPGFFVNGQLLTGAQPYSVFAAAIEAELN